MVPTWQVGVAVSGILVTVLTVYGTLIRRNYDIGSLLRQRLLGTEADETDAGFLVETDENLTSIVETMEDHDKAMRNKISANQEQINQLDSNLTRVEYKLDAVAEVVEEHHKEGFTTQREDEANDGSEEDGQAQRSDSESN